MLDLRPRVPSVPAPWARAEVGAPAKSVPTTLKVGGTGLNRPVLLLHFRKKRRNQGKHADYRSCPTAEWGPTS